MMPPRVLFDPFFLPKKERKRVLSLFFQPERHSSVVLRFLHPTSHVFCVVNVARQARAGVSWTT